MDQDHVEQYHTEQDLDATNQAPESTSFQVSDGEAFLDNTANPLRSDDAFVHR